MLSRTLIAITLLLSTAVGGAFGVSMMRAHDDATAEPAQDKIFEVVHNPPLLVDAGEDVRLAFDVVCIGVPCSAASGQLELVDFEGNAHRMAAEGKGATVTFVVTAKLLAAGPVTYHGSFKGSAKGAEVQWPLSTDQSGPPIRLFEADHVVQLGEARFDEIEESGTTVFAANWGFGQEDLRLSSEFEGPTAFDVDEQGAVYVLDGINARVVQARDGKIERSIPITPAQDFPDLAVGSDGAINVLYPNGGGSGEGHVVRYDATGRSVASIHLAGVRGTRIDARGDSVSVRTPDMSIPVVTDGQPQSDAEQRDNASFAPTIEGRSVIVKHVSDSVVRITLMEDSTALDSWELRGSTPLGPVALSEPVSGGVFVVQTQFTDSESRYLGLMLSSSGEVTTTVLPDSRFIHLTAGGEFRIRNDRLYAARTTKEGLEIAAYKMAALGAEVK